MILDWLANYNFFEKPTILRKLQCNIFGHNWYTFMKNKGKNYCAWCSRYTGDYPKMRVRNPENKKSLQAATQQTLSNNSFLVIKNLLIIFVSFKNSKQF